VIPQKEVIRTMPKVFASRAAILVLALAACSAGADPLSRKTDVDFYRDVLSRDLHGLATRSDGRLVAGPVLTDLAGKAPSELLWCLEPAPGGKWLVGGGPGGRIMEVTADLAAGTFTSKDIVKIPDVQVYALKALPDGSILAGTSPNGGLYLVRAGKVVARTGLPPDSIFDIVLSADGKTALVATGNPGRIYSVDLARFAGAGVSAARTSGDQALSDRGVSLFGEVSDRNLRRIARLSDGRIAAGSAPKGDIYVFEAKGGEPYIAEENHDAEVTDILPDASGGYYASIVFSGGDIHPVQANIQIVSTGEGQLEVARSPDRRTLAGREAEGEHGRDHQRDADGRALRGQEHPAVVLGGRVPGDAPVAPGHGLLPDVPDGRPSRRLRRGARRDVRLRPEHPVLPHLRRQHVRAGERDYCPSRAPTAASSRSATTHPGLPSLTSRPPRRAPRRQSASTSAPRRASARSGSTG
jgi:hypothetical protein